MNLLKENSSPVSSITKPISGDSVPDISISRSVTTDRPPWHAAISSDVALGIPKL